ncbi:unnamed protein product [Adineta steineri]|uniref:Uncharacterized protein n=1 Tax=Adineta steineri TaxID=433720 RepID=A0A815KMF7_9BILA|nr:unnamed protein product [Adineta steineri]CAF1393003.1 unnamed protein product [Adineta steineri]CAF1611698.1 unnamed protein product [Adineta steineri]CAF1611750.1 unnamed protein product [Adineta steineri]
MRRLQRLDLSRNLWASSSEEEEEEEEEDDDDDENDDDNDNNNHKALNNNNNNNVELNNNDLIINPMVTTFQGIQSTSFSSTDQHNIRLSYLPAYPSLQQATTAAAAAAAASATTTTTTAAAATTVAIEDDLLLANIPRQLLTHKQRYRYDELYNFQPSFEIIDQSIKNGFSSFFITKYRNLFVDLTRRLHINDAIVDYNYPRLLKCFDIMIDERLSYGLINKSFYDENRLPIEEYPIALEFFLQIDLNLFFMKTCSFRGAIARNSIIFDGIFCIQQPYATYSMTACRKSNCHFCFPTSMVRNRTQHYQPVIEFDLIEEHRFVSGYRSILNCPATCQTKNILYVLTCPCGKFDYIGYTSMSLDKRLAYHRKHGNRIIHEFLLGPKNILQVQTQPKSREMLVKDDMLLYRHSARCPVAMQLFLSCNPQYWPFVPMLNYYASDENRYYQLPAHIPADPTSPLGESVHRRSDCEAGTCMTDLPPMPFNRYTFSARQCAEQFQYFKNKRDYQPLNNNLDIYNAKIIAVLPNNCSTSLYRLLEVLFITHAQTKLNTLGHLDTYTMHQANNINHSRIRTDVITDRGDWCRSLHNLP